MLGGLPRPAAEAISDTNNVVLDRTVADVAQLKRQMGALETEVAGVKSKAAQVDAREKQLAERVSTVEGRLEGFSSQLMQVAGDTNRKSGGTANAGVAPPASPAAQPPVAPTRVVNAPPPASPARAQPSRLETAGIQVPPADTAAPRTQARQAPPAAAPATGWSPSTEPVTPQPAAAPAVGQVTTQPSGVVLATGPSVDALRLSWSLLNERHRSTLQPLEPRVVIIEPGRYQLVAGPLPNESEATRVCTTLRGRGVACQPSDFRGDRL
jgi:hypothetical protein